MSKNVDLLIIKAANSQEIYGSLSSLTAIEPPVWGGMVANFIRKKGYSVEMIDMEIENLSVDGIVDKIIKTNPLLVDIVVMGPNPSASSTPLMPITRQLLNSLKKRRSNIKTILTGIHPSALPEKTLREEKTDFVGRGESFYTILHLLETLKSGQEIPKCQIKGLWYIKKGKVISNGWGELIQRPDELPMVAWDLIDVEKYRAHNWHCFGHLNERSPYAVIYTSLGCPYNCSYCNIRTLYNGKPGIRFRSPESIIEEIDFLVQEYHVKNIKFLDELFAINEERVNEICDLIIGRGYNLNIWAYARIDTVNKEMLEKMKKAGINWISYGIESGSEKIRKGVHKGIFKQDTVRKVIKITHDAGIYVLGNFIFGLPEDDLYSMQETLNMAKELNCEYVNFYTTMAYPGSQLYEEMINQGVELPSNWLCYAQLAEVTIPLATKYVSSREVLRFRDKAFREYYSRTEYLEMIRKKFGQEEMFHIKEMLKHKLKRIYI